MKASVKLLYEERDVIAGYEIVVEVREWMGDEQLIRALTWDVFKLATEFARANKLVDSGAVIPDVETRADAQRAGIAKFDELIRLYEKESS